MSMGAGGGGAGGEAYLIDVQARYSDQFTAGLRQANQLLTEHLQLLRQIAQVAGAAGVGVNASVSGPGGSASYSGSPGPSARSMSGMVPAPNGGWMRATASSGAPTTVGGGWNGSAMEGAGATVGGGLPAPSRGPRRSAGGSGASMGQGWGGTAAYSRADEESIASLMRPMAQGGMAASRQQAIDILGKTGNLGPLQAAAPPPAFGPAFDPAMHATAAARDRAARDQARAQQQAYQSEGGRYGPPTPSPESRVQAAARTRERLDTQQQPERGLGNLQKAEQSMVRMGNALTSMRTLIAGGVAAAAVAIPMNVANQLSAIQTAYDGILGSMQKGQQLSQQIATLANQSGFGTIGIQQSALQLAKRGQNANYGTKYVQSETQGAMTLAAAYAPEMGTQGAQNVMGVFAQAQSPETNLTFGAAQANQLEAMGIPAYRIMAQYSNEKFGTKYDTTRDVGNEAYLAMQNGYTYGGVSASDYIAKWAMKDPSTLIRASDAMSSPAMRQQRAENQITQGQNTIGQGFQNIAAPLLGFIGDNPWTGTAIAGGSVAMGGAAAASIAARMGLFSGAGSLIGGAAKGIAGLFGAGGTTAAATGAGAATEAAAAAAAAGSAPAAATAASAATAADVAVGATPAAAAAGGIGLGTLAAGAGLLGAGAYGVYQSQQRGGVGAAITQGNPWAGAGVEIGRELTDPNSPIRSLLGGVFGGGGGGNAAPAQQQQAAQAAQQVAQSHDQVAEQGNAVTQAFKDLTGAANLLRNALYAAAAGGMIGRGAGGAWSGGAQGGGAGGGGGSGGFRGSNTSLVIGSGGNPYPFDDLTTQYGGAYANDPEFHRIVAAGAKAESGWDPNKVQPNGGGRGLFQFDLGGMGKGLSDAQLFDPNYQASQIVPKYAQYYQQATAQGMTGAERAAWVAAQAERPADYNNPNSIANQNYRSAYNDLSTAPGGGAAGTGGTVVNVGDVTVQAPAIDASDPQSLKVFVDAGTDQIMREIGNRMQVSLAGATSV